MGGVDRGAVGVVGASGRLGTAVCAALAAHPTLQLARCLARDAAAQRLLDVAGLPATCEPSAWAEACDLLIDCSAPAACARLLPVAVRARRPYLVASTGLGALEREAIAAATQQVAVLVAANLSAGVAVLARLLQQAAAALPEFDVQVLDLHHRHKRDAPSGTALALGAVLPAGRAVDYAALRGGDVAGEHTVYLCGPGERLELTHRSSGSALFAHGALRALQFLRTAPPGLYGMDDVLRQRADHADGG